MFIDHRDVIEAFGGTERIQSRRRTADPMQLIEPELRNGSPAGETILTAGREGAVTTGSKWR